MQSHSKEIMSSLLTLHNTATHALLQTMWSAILPLTGWPCFGRQCCPHLAIQITMHPYEGGKLDKILLVLQNIPDHKTYWAFRRRKRELVLSQPQISLFWMRYIVISLNIATSKNCGRPNFNALPNYSLPRQLSRQIVILCFLILLLPPSRWLSTEDRPPTSPTSTSTWTASWSPQFR